MLYKDPTEALGLAVEGRAVDPEPPANGSPGKGQLGLDLRPCSKKNDSARLGNGQIEGGFLQNVL